MRALRFHAFGEAPRVMDIEVPVPGPGQVLLRVAAAGVCHSDEWIMSTPPENWAATGAPFPITLGHEAAGEVISLGAGVENVAIGESVLVYGPWGCGRCASCAAGSENYCRRPGGPRPPGIKVDGAMAEYLLVPAARHLVPLGDLDPVAAVALTDAGLTSYHAILECMPRLRPGSTALVLGVGGLGHLAVQILRAVAPGVRVIAVDARQDKLDLAVEVGAHHALLAGPGAEERVLELTAGSGADVVLDMVRVQPTVDLGRRVVAQAGVISLVGAGPGVLEVAVGRLPMGVSVLRPFWGTLAELWQVVELARAGLIRTEFEVHPLEAGPEVYERLRAGDVRGRAVLVPGRDGSGSTRPAG
ncbi:NAD(P)-dependent alcohol dehydrogenase [Modestobacter versicolor]|uniref:NAD(P)-dependent alcohol dehydrogenase n=1 Tax=Modestobacter versicolor TaxID=429133 RepID=UPI0034DED032